MGLLLGSGSTKPQYPYDMWYGVQGDFTSKDKKLKRVGNMDLHRTLPIQSKLRRFVENPDGSVKYYLHQNDSRKKEGGLTAKLDTTDGNVMYEKPKYYSHFEIEGTKWLRAYSEYPLPGFVEMSRKTVSPWYATLDSELNVAVSGCFLTWAGDEIARDPQGNIIYTANAARFRGGYGASDADKDGTHNSQLGMARTALDKAGFRKYCKNGTHLGVYRVYNEIAWLQRVEYASLDCQDTYKANLTPDGFRQGGLGEGCAVASSDWNTWGGYRPFVPGGVTAPLGNNTGKVSYTIKGWPGGDKVIQVTSYRGFEVPFQYLWLLADDVLIHHSPDSEKGESIGYICDDPTKFTSHADMATVVPDGYKPIAKLPRQEGYILYFAMDGNGNTMPGAIGGSYNLGACDYFWHPGATASGWRGALLSADANYGATAGFGCLGANNRSSYADAHCGFRLCRN